MTTPDLQRLRSAFEGGELTVGIEEELMLLDEETFDLAPVAHETLEVLAGDPRFKGELPAAQIELITEPADTVAEAAVQVQAARERLADAASQVGAVPAGSGAHPFAAAKGELSQDPKYEFTRSEYGPVAERQLVFGLHVHVRVPGVERAVAVYNALRAYLPALAALGANAPFYEGEDSGFASVRPMIGQLLPRQGIPPELGAIEELADAYAFGRASGTFEPGAWWWELRLHPVHGTVEVRVPDQQTAVWETAALAALVHSLVSDLAGRLDAGERLPTHSSWAIAESRWLAARHGLAGGLLDIATGERRPARAMVESLIESLGPTAERLGCGAELGAAARLAQQNGSERQQALGTARSATEEVAGRFLSQD